MLLLCMLLALPHPVRSLLAEQALLELDEHALIHAGHFAAADARSAIRYDDNPVIADIILGLRPARRMSN